MTKEEFDTIKVGDILTNKIDINDRFSGYDYEVIGKTENEMDVKDLTFFLKHTIKRNEVEGCLNFRKK